MRELRQKEAVNAFLLSDGKTIINAAPRFGKIKVAIDILNELGGYEPLIFGPRKDIEKGWKDDFKKFNAKAGYKFMTFASIKKIISTSHRFIIIDEPHEMSVNQQRLLKPFVDKAQWVLGLTGTMTDKTANELYDNLGLNTCYKYTIEKAVEDGILADYQIYIHKIPLDNKTFVYTTAKGKKYTEKGYFDLFTYIRKDAKQKHFIDMRLINIIQNSRSKLQETRHLLNKYSQERILVFCGTTEIANKLEIPVYHSKRREVEIFNSFCKGEKYNQLATIKMMQAGITITPIKKGIINYTSGNPEDCAQKVCRFLGFEYDNPNKEAEIHIISSNEEFEASRLKTALLFFDQKKIHLSN